VLGRSNVGKSSLINRLVGIKGLARTSSTPGRTRRIHFYRLDARAYLVDLPGYGYAAGPEAERRAFGPLVESYLTRERETLHGALVLIDVRRGAEHEERELCAFLAAQNIELRVALTKGDKVKRNELEKTRRETTAALGLVPQHVAVVSAKDGTGLGATAEWLSEKLGLAIRRADGKPFPH
jgi:GTP-binding protein